MMRSARMDLLHLPRPVTAWTGFVAVTVLAGLVAWTLRRTRGSEPTDLPVPRLHDYPWMSVMTWKDRHEALVRIDPGAKQKAKLVFLGDSIVEGWDQKGFAERFASDRALRLGIGGDRTQHVLWRIIDGELDGVHPEVVVLLIGINNIIHDAAAPASVAKGVAAIVQTVQAKLPGTQVLVLGLLPHGELPSAPVRQTILGTNRLLANLADGERVRFLDVGHCFLTPDGKIPKELMADFLHPTPQGYGVLSEAIESTIREMMGPSARTPREIQ